MLSLEAQKILVGIREKAPLRPKEMADTLNLTFFPYTSPQSISEDTRKFTEDLKKAFVELKVNVVPYAEALEKVPLSKIIVRFCKIVANDLLYGARMLFHLPLLRPYIGFQGIVNILRRKRIKRGISVIAVGESPSGNLPMDNTSSFRESSVVTIVDWPPHITENSGFDEHFDTAMSLFAHHMTNIVIAVNATRWLLYNFNASHPVYDRTKNLKENILQALIPKIAAPIRPVRLSEFHLMTEPFDVSDPQHEPGVQDLVRGSRAFHETKLYPKGKKVSDLPFRNSFYQWIGNIHLDERSGMSYGFLARQMPTPLMPLLTLAEAKKRFGARISPERDYFKDDEGNVHLLLQLQGSTYSLQTPEVWVLTQRSGSHKTNFDPRKDLIKLGLRNGELFMQIPTGLRITPEYKPSFDTRVILAHALGNAIAASILNHFRPKNDFSLQCERKGFGISHWHGYIRMTDVPKGWHVYGSNNPHVSCSSPQSALYALGGKLNAVQAALQKNATYRGDIHIEPHHGTNITFSSIYDLARFFTDRPDSTVLGNKYLPLHHA